jgi:predicted P-loop ATPase/GTPase
MEFPRFVYVKGSTAGEIVHDEVEYRAAIEAGFFPSVPEAMAGKLVEVAKPEPVRLVEPIQKENVPERIVSPSLKKGK